MNKKLVIVILGLFISSSSFSGIFKGKGQSGPLEVIEIGPNVKANIVSKIEQTRNTLESIQQTKNQILQLKNDALNLSKWTDTALQETLGISQADIQNIKEIQKLSGSLYNDVKNFEKNWKKEFGMDFEKMDIKQLGNAQNKLSNRIDEIKKNIIREGNDLSNKAAELEKNVKNKLIIKYDIFFIFSSYFIVITSVSVFGIILSVSKRYLLLSASASFSFCILL